MMVRSRAWCVEPGWAALIVPAPIPRRLPAVGGERLHLDREAAAVAVAVASKLASVAPWHVSRSHSAGAGAAIVMPPGWRAGVDVMPVERVTIRHARAVASDAELALVSASVEAEHVPAVIWTLKEAGAKATGVRGLGAMPDWIITRAAAGRAELTCVFSDTCLTSGWLIADAFACAWATRPDAGDHDLRVT